MKLAVEVSSRWSCVSDSPAAAMALMAASWQQQVAEFFCTAPVRIVLVYFRLGLLPRNLPLGLIELFPSIVCANAGDLMREEFEFINNYLKAISSYLAFLPHIRTSRSSSFTSHQCLRPRGDF